MRFLNQKINALCEGAVQVVVGAVGGVRAVVCRVGQSVVVCCRVCARTLERKQVSSEPVLAQGTRAKEASKRLTEEVSDRLRRRCETLRLAPHPSLYLR